MSLSIRCDGLQTNYYYYFFLFMSKAIKYYNKEHQNNAPKHTRSIQRMPITL